MLHNKKNRIQKGKYVTIEHERILQNLSEYRFPLLPINIVCYYDFSDKLRRFIN